MILDWIFTLKEEIDKHGIRWGLLFTLYAIYRKERRNYRLDRRDEIHQAYFEVILHKLGGATCADTLNRIKEPSRPRGVGGFIYSLEEKLIALFARKSTNLNMRRKRRMNTANVNWMTLVPALLGVLKLILQPLGVDLSHITDEQVNTIINGIAAAIAVWGVFKSHNKGVNNNVATQSGTTFDNNK